MQCRECGAETPNHQRCIECGAPAAMQRSRPADPAAATLAMPGGAGDGAGSTVSAAEAPAWSSGRPAPTVLAGGADPDDDVSDVVPARRRGRIAQITIAGASVLTVAVATVALAAHGHASTPFGLMATLTGSGDPGYSVAFSPDGRMLAAGTNLWDFAARHQIGTLTDPGVIDYKAVAFSPDGHTLASGGDNGNTYLWDVPARHRIAILSDPHSAGVSSLAFSPDGHTLATNDINGTYLWSVS